MNNENLGPENIQPTKRVSGIWDKLRTRLMVFSLLGLITMNVLTLVNDQVHAVGYSVIEAVIASTVTDAVVDRILSGSPTATKQRAVSVATSKMQDDFEKTNRAMIARNAAVTKQLTDLSIKHVALEKTHAEIETKHTNLKQKSEKNTSIVSAISSRIGKRAAFNATRSVSSFALKAVPYAGVASLIVFTGFDLNDACQTMKDLNALNFEFALPSDDADMVCGLKVPFLGG